MNGNLHAKETRQRPNLALVSLVITQSNSHMGLKQLTWFSWEILLPTSRCHIGLPQRPKSDHLFGSQSPVVLRMYFPSLSPGWVNVSIVLFLTSPLAGTGCNSVLFRAPLSLLVINTK